MEDMQKLLKVALSGHDVEFLLGLCQDTKHDIIERKGQATCENDIKFFNHYYQEVECLEKKLEGQTGITLK